MATPALPASAGRTLTEDMRGAIAGRAASARAYLVEIKSSAYSGSVLREETLRFTDAAADLAWDGHTWTAVGGEIAIGAASETADAGRQGIDITVPGTDRSFVQLVEFIICGFTAGVQPLSDDDVTR